MSIARKWTIAWKEMIPGYDTVLKRRIRLHTMRKTFAMLAVRSGWDLLQISTYGNWSLPSAVIFYVVYIPNVALGIAKTFLIQQHKKHCEYLNVDMNNLSTAHKKLYH